MTTDNARCTLDPICGFGPHDSSSHPCGRPVEPELAPSAQRRWFNSKGYWLWRRATHRWACGGRWLADGGCIDCDLVRRYTTVTRGPR